MTLEPPGNRSTEGLEILQREILQQRWKYCNRVGNIATTFRPPIFVGNIATDIFRILFHSTNSESLDIVKFFNPSFVRTLKIHSKASPRVIVFQLQ